MTDNAISFALAAETEAQDRIADASDGVKTRIRGLENEYRENDAKRSARRAEIEDLNERIHEAGIQLQQAIKEEEKTGEKYFAETTEIDPKTGGEVVTRKPTGYVENLQRALKGLQDTRRELLDKKSKRSFIEQVREDLGEAAPRPLIEAEPITWQPNKGEQVADGYKREFFALSALLKEEDRIWNAFRTVAEIERTALAEIDALAEAGTPGFGGHRRGHMIGHRGRQVATTPKIAWPRERLGLDATEAADAPALMAWLFRDQMKAAASKHIRATYTDEGTISAADKPAKLAAIAEKIWHQRRVVEAAYLYARAHGVTNLNRPKSTPTEILLDVLPWGKRVASVMPKIVPEPDTETEGEVDTADA